MINDYICIKLCSNESIRLSNLNVKLKDKCDKTVSESM